jgi:hypothetical protein
MLSTPTTEVEERFFGLVSGLFAQFGRRRIGECNHQKLICSEISLGYMSDSEDCE